MKPLKIGAYCRVSTDDQVNVYEGSLETQKSRINEFVEFKNRQQKGWGDVVEFYVEEGQSAGTTNRTQYQRMMNDVRSGKVNLILVSDLTRLSRNLLDFCNLINELEERKASYLSMKEQFDTSTPIGRMMVYIIIALGQFEREQTSERVSINVHTRATKGLINGGSAPLGYDRHPEMKGLLIVNEAEAKVAEMIFETFLACGSRAKTIEALHEKGIFPKKTSKRGLAKGSVHWSVQSLKGVLENKAYIGYREVNKLYKDEDGEELKPWQQYSVVKAPWKPIVSETVFFDAQKLLEEAANLERERMSSSETREFLLTGLLRCGESGQPLVGKAAHGRKGRIYRYYHFSRTPKNFKELRGRLSADEIEEKVMSELKSSLKKAGYFEQLEAMLKHQSMAQTESSSGELQRATAEINELNRRFENLLLNQGQMQLSEEALRLTSEQLNLLAKKRKDLEGYIKSLKRPDSIAPKSKAMFVQNQIKALFQGWEKSTSASRKRLLRRTIKEIVITDGVADVTFWTTPEELMRCSPDVAFEGPEAENVLPLRRRAVKNSDQNPLGNVSPKVRNGSGEGT